MTIKTLKMTAAVIALTAGTALADDHSAPSKTPNAGMSSDVKSVDIGTGATMQAKTDANKQMVDMSEEEAVRYTEENVREATEGQINVADGGVTDFSDTEAQLSGDVDDEGTTATDEFRPTASVPVDADKSYATGETTTADLTAFQDSDIDVQTVVLSEEFSGMTAGQLIGLRVYDAEGERTGEVDNIVQMDGAMMAIVGIGGFLGLGEHDVAVALDRFEKGGTDELRLVEMTAAQLEAMTEYDAAAAEEVDEATRIDEDL